MTLNSPTFLFIFLPIFLIFYFISPFRYRNFLLLLFSLFFFIWGDPLYAPFIFVLVLISFLMLRGMQNAPQGSRQRRAFLSVGVVANLASLICFKLFSAFWQPLLSLAQTSGIAIQGWVASNLSRLAHIPLGFSFLALLSISMLLDAFWRDPEEQPRFLPVSLYLLMFPKAQSGPIMRFRETAALLKQRTASLEKAAAGARRFMLGFAKKALIADQLSLLTDRGIFNQNPAQIPFGLAWLAIVSYTLQIYFDFSAYSDMAIGLGQVLGFDFGENFNYPYAAVSITDFWRRWHISLSNWFRDYVFYPLEMSRRSSSWLSQPLNILIVFLLTGLWHGVTPPFIVWGLLQGGAIALERGPFGAWLQRLWRPFQHAYALAVIMLGWVFFSAASLPYAWNFLKALAGASRQNAYLPFSVFPPVSTLIWAALAAGIVFSFPVVPAFLKRMYHNQSSEKMKLLALSQNLMAVALFVIALIVQAGTSYAPFIYGGF
jgi:alginate O-acetyltransferase complex protein AlgI